MSPSTEPQLQAPQGLRGRLGRRGLVLAAVVTMALLAALLVRLVAEHSSAAGPPDVRAPDPSAAQVDACRALVAARPATVDGQSARATSPPSPYTAAWGDPAIVLRCGVEQPAALRPTSQCFEINHVGWLATFDGRPAPEHPVDGPLVFTTIGRSVYVEVTVPAAYQPASNALIDLTPTIAAHTSVEHACV